MQLTDQEKADIIKLIEAGRPLPSRYRATLFEDVAATELIWPGKSAEVERTVLPLQSIEQIDEPRTETRDLDLFSLDAGSGRQLSGWTNKLIWGDNQLVLSSLTNGPLRAQIEAAGGLKLVYIDPPFDVGADFSIDVEIGDAEVTKRPSVVEEVAYRDTWGRGRDSFLAMIYERVTLIHGLLAPGGSFFLHCDWRLEGQIRVLLDELFGADGFANSIVWCYTSPGNFPKWLPRRHDTILWYVKGNLDEGSHTFNRDAIRVPYVKLDTGKTQGIFKSAKTLSEDGKVPEDWWSDITPVARLHATELLGFPTQKPEKLLDRIITMASNPGDLVADFFCGSGTTLAVAEKLGRKWIGTDLGRFAVHTSRKRMIQIQRDLRKEMRPFRAFEILNLGQYERQHFAGIDPTLPADQRKVLSAERERQYLDLILTAYSAERAEALPPFHGVKGAAAVFVGPLDAPVTQRDVRALINSAKSAGVTRADVLGFEFEMGITPAMSDEAKEEGVTLTLRYIPNDVFDKRAIARGQVRFYDVGYLEAKATVSGRSVSVTLADFGVFYAQEDADQAAAALRNGASKVVVDQGQVVRVAKDRSGKVEKDVLTKKWSDWIDYWAVDFDFENKREILTLVEAGDEKQVWSGRYIFENQWQSFRTKQSRELELTSAEHSYESSGEYKIAVKVIDVFGNDTTKVVRVKVK